MPKDHNFNQSRESSNGSNTSTDECRQHLSNKTKSNNTNHETIDLVDCYRAEDSLTIQYPGQHNKQNRKYKVVLCCIFTAVLLLILSGMVVYLTIEVSKEKKANTSVLTKTGKSIQNNKVEEINQGGIKQKINESNDECTTKTCKEIADSLRKAMNLSADPCENFYEYSCGLWPTSHPLPAWMGKLDTMTLLNLKKNIYLQNTIAAVPLKPHKRGYKSKIIKFYKSCMNVGLINKLGKKPLIDLIDTFGEWSIIKTWRAKGEIIPDLTTLLVKTHRYFCISVYDDRLRSPLFKSVVKVSDKNSKTHIIEINIPDLSITDNKVFLSSAEREKKILLKYKLLQTNYAALLGPANDAKKKLKELTDFEIALANISFPFRQSMYPKYVLSTLSNIQKQVGDQINIYRYVKETFAPLNIAITEETKIGVLNVGYFKSLNELIKKTKLQTIKDYIIWTVVFQFGSYASFPFQEADFNFKQALSGIEERPEKKEKCIADIEQTMEFGLTALYVEKALDEEDKILATEIIQNITKAMRRNLVNVEWMDVNTKSKAFEKLDLIVGNIGYPDFIKNETYLNLLYKKVHVQSDTYFENVLNMYRFKRNKNIGILSKVVDRTAYDLPPTLVEAYFDPNKNKMVFLAGILQKPFYAKNAPMALNYGALGLVAGHEVTHSFDTLGRLFDGNGEKVNWWSNSSENAFSKRSKCIIDQYSNYTIYGAHVNGITTLGENIADNGGIKLAYMAYKTWERIHGTDKKLPGIPLTMDQLLFVSLGQVWCGTYRKEHALTALTDDYHSPSKFRINGPLSNLKEFSKAFQCPVGSPMNPKNKCRVW